jgi:malto-oligosyltrehalose trehalohydrolase
MVFLDVVYNHFGPDGNFLHLYAPQFFTERHHTPWGAGIKFDGAASRTVRDFFVHNALYWLTEYRLDGLRLDAVHAIADDSDPDILVELAEAVHAGPGRERPVHLVLENDHNAARYLERRPDGPPRCYTAQWNDDFHHALHLLASGEDDGYYVDYADGPAYHLGRCLAEGNAFQGEPSAFRGGTPRGEPSAHLPPTAFVVFLQNHDQVGNRACGERIDQLASPEALRAALTVLLLAPSPPLVFMGQEFMARSPFLFFCDFADHLAEAVSNGRRREFRRFERFADPEAQASIPDPNDPDTFRRSALDWQDLDLASHRDWLNLHRELLDLRRREIVPRLTGIPGGAASFHSVGPGGLRVVWTLGDGSRLTLIANLSADPLSAAALAAPAEDCLLRAEPATTGPSPGPEQPPWAAAWYLKPADAPK